MCVDEFFLERGIRFQIPFADLAARPTKHRRDTGLLVIQACAQPGVRFGLHRHYHVLGQRGIDFFAG